MPLCVRDATPGPNGPGLSLDRPPVMGILNVTPDSFSEAAAGRDRGGASRPAWPWRRTGADIIDVGGESTRPGAAAVPPDIEQDRSCR